MAAPALLQIALDLLVAVQAKRTPPPPEKVNTLRRARPDLAHLSIEELAGEVFLSEMARPREQRSRKESRTA